jgi:hypothetical protein
MSGNLRDRPFLLLLMRVLRIMLAVSAVAMIVVGGAIIYSITSVQKRSLDSLTAAETTAFILLGIFALVSVMMIAATTRILHQNGQ